MHARLRELVNQWHSHTVGVTSYIFRIEGCGAVRLFAIVQRNHTIGSPDTLFKFVDFLRIKLLADEMTQLYVVVGRKID